MFLFSLIYLRIPVCYLRPELELEPPEELLELPPEELLPPTAPELPEE